MAHCVYPEKKMAANERNGVFIAHCPESNMNLSSGVAPVRTFLEEGMHVGIGSDVAGGSTENLFKAMALAIQASKLRWRMQDDGLKPLTLRKYFTLPQKAAEFFGNVEALNWDLNWMQLSWMTQELCIRKIWMSTSGENDLSGR